MERLTSIVCQRNLETNHPKRGSKVGQIRALGDHLTEFLATYFANSSGVAIQVIN